MNLKLVVALMSILGVVSCPVFAATDTNQSTDQSNTTQADATQANTQTDTTTAPKHKVKKHHHHRHHVVKEIAPQPEVAYHPDYKGMALAAPAADVCTISQSSMILDNMTQNMGRSLPNGCNPGWFDRIRLSGGIYVQNAWGSRNANLMGEAYQHLALNDVYLNLGATINDWAKAFASLSYNTETINDPTSATILSHVSEYSSAYSNNVTGGSSNQIQVEQAFATFGNFEFSPIFVQLGKQFQDFSRYPIHPITRSLTQVISETLATSAKIGFIAGGFNGSLAAFDDPMAKVGQSSRPANYVFALGYDGPSDAIGWDVGAAYIYNLIGVNDVAYNVGQFNINNAINNDFGYQSRVGAIAAYADVNSGPFIVSGRYTVAVQRFNVNDLPKNGVADLNAANGVPLTTATGAKPWAAGVQAAYGYELWGKNQNVYVGYQASRESAGLELPKSRWLVGYGLEFWRNADFGIEWDHDIAYKVANGGSGNTTNLVNLRAGVKFA